MLDLFIYIVSVFLLLVGFVGCFLPIIPGPLVAFFGVFLLHFASGSPFSTKFLVIRFLIHIFALILDNIIPVRGAKMFKGTKRGIWGSTIGMIFAVIILPFLGVVLGPFGIVGLLLGPFVGAYIGEIIHTQNPKQAIRSAIGSFVGFLSGVLIKILLTVVMSYYVFEFLF